MGLTEYIEKLITEHGSSVILRDHLAFVKEQCATLEKGLAKANTEKEAAETKAKVLEGEVSELRLELQRLNDFVSAQTVHVNSKFDVRIPQETGLESARIEKAPQLLQGALKESMRNE